MFSLSFVIVGILLTCLFAIVCCNYISYEKGEDLNATPNPEETQPQRNPNIIWWFCCSNKERNSTMANV